MRVLSRKLTRDARRRRSQLVAIVVTVFLGVALYAASFDAFRNLQVSYESLYDGLSFADVTLVGGDPEAVARAVAEIDGIAAVETRTVAETPLRIGRADKLLGRIVEVPPDRLPEVNSVMVLQGALPSSLSRSDVLVEQHMAEHFRLGVGDRLEVLTPTGWSAVEVAAVVASPEYLWPARSRQEVLTSPGDFGVLFGSGALIEGVSAESTRSEVAVRLADGADGGAAIDEVVSLGTAAGAVSTFDQTDQPSNAALQEDVRGFGEMSFLFPVLFLGAAGMATSVLLTRLVISQRAQIGLLRANGFSRRTIFGHYLVFGLAAGLLGAVPGAVAGSLLARAITGLYTDAISVPITVIEFRPSTVAAGVGFGLAAGALSGLGPAIRASRLAPAEAMRAAGSAAPPRTGFVERVIPILKRLPAPAKMVLRGIGRNRGRSLATGTGVVLAIVLILASWGMIDTMQILLARQFEEVQGQHAQVFVERIDTLSELRSLDGVAAVEPAAQLPVTILAADTRYQSSVIALPPDTAMHTFRMLDGGDAPLPAAGLYVGRALRSLAGIDVGDTFTLVFGDTRLEETVAGFVDEPLGTTAYMTLPALAADLGAAEPTVVNAAMIRYEPGADLAAMRAVVVDVPGVRAYVDARALYDTVQRFMGLFYAFVGIMLAFGAVMAFALIFNTVSANIAERAGEVGTMKANGVGRRIIGRLITAENLLLMLLSVGPGLVVGHLAAAAMMSSFSSDLFRFDAVIRPTTYVFTALAIVVVGLASQGPVLRRLQELDVAQIVRERSL